MYVYVYMISCFSIFSTPFVFVVVIVVVSLFFAVLLFMTEWLNFCLFVVIIGDVLLLRLFQHYLKGMQTDKHTHKR